MSFDAAGVYHTPPAKATRGRPVDGRTVCLVESGSMRDAFLPLLLLRDGEAAAEAAAPEKMFFLEHFVRTLDSSPAPRR